MKFTIKVLSLLLSVLFLAACTSLVPRSDKPEDYFTITVNSIPSGANVYEVEATDGSLGRLLGETPYDLRVGIAPRRWSNGNLALQHGGTEWGAGVTWAPYRRDSNRVVSWDLLLNVAVVKEGYYPKRVKNRNVYTFGPRHRYPPYNTTVTALLRPKEDSQSRAPQQQQQQQQQQQTVVIPRAETTARGMIMVTSTPEYAEIYADGAFIGNTPANLKLSEGIHIIEVKIAGFTPYRKALRVIGSSELNLRVTLEKE